MIPQVVASESGEAQTGVIHHPGVAGPPSQICRDQLNGLEKPARDRDSRVNKLRADWEDIPSSAVHVKLRANPSRPLDKAKYSSATDSEQVPRGKGEKNPC